MLVQGPVRLKEFIDRKSRRVLALIALQQIVDEIVVAVTICIQVIEYIKVRRACEGRFPRRRYSLTTRMSDQVGRFYRLVSSSNETCLINLRMDRNAFGRLCYMLEQSGGVKPTKNVSVPEQVAMFLNFIFVLSGWEGSAADSRVLRDAIHKPNGLRVRTGAMEADLFSTAHVNTLEDEGSSQQKRRGNKDRSGSRRTWTIVEEEALINGLVLGNDGVKV
ncbi:UNVERIFIED_CONTAM: hypothetical protein Sangu_2777600 [Sesamum angustifolium]|uniref:DUF8040 domain-containing protein n=1 Tax=Sesamum angustifolium TaxID=2727405 RepID=A0AAW2ITP2_9LAMI